MKPDKKILLSYNEAAHKLALEKAEAIEQALLDLIQYTEDNAKIKINDLQAFCEDPIQYSKVAFWKLYKAGFSAPIDSAKAIQLTTYEIDEARALYARWIQLAKDKPITDKEKFCTYVGKGKEQFFKDAKSLEDAIKGMREKYDCKFRNLELIRAIPFLKFGDGIDFTLSPSDFI